MMQDKTVGINIR